MDQIQADVLSASEPVIEGVDTSWRMLSALLCYDVGRDFKITHADWLTSIQKGMMPYTSAHGGSHDKVNCCYQFRRKPQWCHPFPWANT